LGAPLAVDAGGDGLFEPGLVLDLPAVELFAFGVERGGLDQPVRPGLLDEPAFDVVPARERAGDTGDSRRGRMIAGIALAFVEVGR
jgi:hypothetical protein